MPYISMLPTDERFRGQRCPARVNTAPGGAFLGFHGMGSATFRIGWLVVWACASMQDARNQMQTAAERRSVHWGVFHRILLSELECPREYLGGRTLHPEHA